MWQVLHLDVRAVFIGQVGQELEDASPVGLSVMASACLALPVAFVNLLPGGVS